METKQETKRDAAQICKDFNDAWSVGTLVEYWKGTREGSPDGIELTRSAAWPMCGTPSVLLHNVLGPIPLDHVNVISAPSTAFQPVDHESV